MSQKMSQQKVFSKNFKKFHDAIPPLSGGGGASWKHFEFWETQKGTMGQQGVDFQPAPYRLGRSMLQRIMGLLGKDVDTNSLVG